ncbi:Transcriptional regulator sdnM [Colletotrichum trifolii]|uniref:Transcriptional regulator sdnM n=1 Tax=Colletotrichum trifolii TaxID=5466 RepID=A0A4R8RIL1_COLTR|nr:Transcriptional regulator sdnM [Colletotrichum trifolii]
MDAWGLMLQGRDDEVFVPYWSDMPDIDFDPLAKLGRQPTEPYKLLPRMMSSVGMGIWALGHISEFLGKQETRVVRVPKEFLDRLVKTTRAKLRESSLTNDAEPFLSESDVLCAWWTKVATSSHLPRTSRSYEQTLVLNNAYSPRKPLGGESGLLPTSSSCLRTADKPYLSNAVGFINVVGSVADELNNPVSRLAAQIRSAIRELGTRSQAETAPAMTRSNRLKLPPFFGDTTMHMVTYSNWTKAGLFEIDISGAVINSEAGRKELRGMPVYIQNNQSGFVLPNGFVIPGKDSGGNYWLSGYMDNGLWAKMEIYMRTGS